MNIHSLACFIREAICTNKSTGAIAPSSSVLARGLVEAGGVGKAGVIVEYGPGTGAITEVILQKKRSDAHFMAMEVNHQFVEATRKRCPEAIVHHDCAQNTRRYLEEAGHAHCDVIVSGLPWSVFDDALQDTILASAYDVLRPGGRFVTFRYPSSPYIAAGHRFFREKLPARFEKLHPEVRVWRNLPPSVIFCAEKG